MKKKDILLLSSLRNNSRDSLTNISRKINIPVSTLFDRLKVNQKNVIKKHTALIDFSQMGFSARANITLKVSKRHRENLKLYLSRHSNVNSISKINNGFDFLIEVIFKNIRDIEDFLEDIEEKFKLRTKQVYYIIEEIKKEEFMSDPNLINLIEVCS